MFLAAILFSCKLGGQDVKIIIGIRHFWIQHTQIDLKSHRYRFFPHLHLTSLLYQSIKYLCRKLYNEPQSGDDKTIIMLAIQGYLSSERHLMGVGLPLKLV